MNLFIINNKTYYFESVWRKDKDDNSKDTDGNRLPYPQEGHQWTNKTNFLIVLKKITNHLEDTDKIFKTYKTSKKCLICGESNIATKLYKYAKCVWEDSLYHYIDEHNIEPSEKFMDKMYFTFGKHKAKNNRLNIEGDIVNMDDSKELYYVKLKSNQIMIMDALMYHGGYTKKYVDAKTNNFRYSEHAGLLDFEGRFLDKVIVSGHTNRVDKGDDDIYLPSNMREALKYEYLFHTHPPTPKPGGRSDDGILFEFPSIGDILHFIDHCNDGKTIGSLVVAPEGMYNIRKLHVDAKKIKLDEDLMFKQVNKGYSSIQEEALTKYGTDFSTYDFYSKISQDLTYINKLNKILNIFKLHIDFFPRRRDNKGKWIIDNIYLPIYK